MYPDEAALDQVPSFIATFAPIVARRVPGG
jgi:hypothetical protein